MAEGFARTMGANQVAVTSAGLDSSYIDPVTIQVMDEVGIDIRNQTSQALSEFNSDDFDAVISLCGCGVNLPKDWLLRDVFEDWQLDDPEGESIDTFRHIRDAVKERVSTLLKSL